MTLRAGLDIGGTKTAVLLVDAYDQPLARVVHPTDITSPDDLVAGTVAVVGHALSNAGRDWSDLAAAGVGVPGQVDPTDGTVRMAVNLNLRQPYPLRQALGRALGVPVTLENDVRTAAWGAFHWAGEREPLSSLAYLSIGTGIAAGLVLDNRLWRGAHGMAGEIGHIPIEPAGPRCVCGAYGCLEALAAGPAIAARAAEAMPDWAGDPPGGSHQQPTTAEVYRLAAEGYPVARRIVEDAAGYLSRAVYLLLMAYDVEKVAIGGGVTLAGAAFERPLRAAMSAMRADSPLTASMMPDEKVVIIPPDYNAGVMGAVYLASVPNEVEEVIGGQ